MARLGVTYHDVANAAERVVAQGKVPTIELVRQVLRTGSTTTIANHLRKWRIEREEVYKTSGQAALPDEMIGLMHGLWERLQHHADCRIEEMESRHRQEVDLLKQEIEKYKTNNQRWQKLFDQWTKEKEELTTQHTALEAEFDVLKEEKISLAAQDSAKEQCIQEKNQRINELHHLHSQAQTNLEHYRESTREQRLLDQAQFEQKKQEMQQEMKVYKGQFILTKEKITTVEQDYNVLHQNYQTLISRQGELLANQKMQSEQLAETKVLLQEQQQASQLWEERYCQNKNTLDEKTHEIIELQTEKNELLRLVKDSNTTLKEQLEYVESLRQEKLLLVQEKAQLEGRLSEVRESIAIDT